MTGAPIMASLSQIGRYVLCVKNRGYTASLDVRKVYRVKPYAEALSHGFLRVFDESHRDYLYPIKYFMPIEVPRAAAVASSASS